MRWREPARGETRVVKRFLIFPKCLPIEGASSYQGEKQHRWWEYAMINQEYFGWGWVDKYWVREKNYE